MPGRLVLGGVTGERLLETLDRTAVSWNRCIKRETADRDISCVLLPREEVVFWVYADRRSSRSADLEAERLGSAGYGGWASRVSVRSAVIRSRASTIPATITPAMRIVTRPGI